MTGVIAVGASPEETIRQFSNAVGVPPPVYSPVPTRPGDVFVWLPHNLNMFIQIAEGLDDETWLYHLRRSGSQWMREAIKDEALANEVHEIEKDGKEGPLKTRTAVIEAINRRYTRCE